MSALRLEAGGGMSVFAALKLAVVESRLPSNTSHVGPPSYQIMREQRYLVPVHLR
jgi:hypothetical protein